jgi:formylmethanofuran dehydrogenase subunit E
MKINTYSREEYLHQLKSFHGSLAPGLIIGGSMVNLALRSLPKAKLFDAICETPLCLPDAIQLLTPCTIGNGWLTVLNFGRFAITLYEKDSGMGVRVYLDSVKLKKYPEVYSWYFKLKPKNEQDFQLLINQIVEAEEKILSLQHVRVQPESLRRKKIGPVADCPQCGECYPVRDGLSCRACQGESPYVEVETPELIGKSLNFTDKVAVRYGDI